MSEWQPARFRQVHPRHSPLERGDQKVWNWNQYRALTNGAIIRTRVRQPSDYIAIERFREMGCDSNTFFIIHPEDSGLNIASALCEHEILTD